MDFVRPAQHGQLDRVTGVDEMGFDARNVEQLWRVLERHLGPFLKLAQCFYGTGQGRALCDKVDALMDVIDRGLVSEIR